MNNALTFFYEMIKMKEKHVIKGNAALDKLCGLWLGQEMRDRGEEEKGYNQFNQNILGNWYGHDVTTTGNSHISTIVYLFIYLLAYRMWEIPLLKLHLPFSYKKPYKTIKMYFQS